MSVQITCPHCQRALKVQDSTRGKRVRCPLCGGTLRVPGSGPETFGLGPPPPPRPPLDIPPTVPTFNPPEEDLEYATRRRETVAPLPARVPESDGAGITGLTFGIIAVACLVLGFCTCGITFFAAPVFAGIGLMFSVSAHGGLRSSALTLNTLALVPALVMVVLTFMGVTSSVLREARQQQQSTIR